MQTLVRHCLLKTNTNIHELYTATARQLDNSPSLFLLGVTRRGAEFSSRDVTRASCLVTSGVTSAKVSALAGVLMGVTCGCAGSGCGLVACGVTANEWLCCAGFCASGATAANAGGFFCPNAKSPEELVVDAIGTGAGADVTTGAAVDCVSCVDAIFPNMLKPVPLVDAAFPPKLKPLALAVVVV